MLGDHFRTVAESRRYENTTRKPRPNAPEGVERRANKAANHLHNLLLNLVPNQRSVKRPVIIRLGGDSPTNSFGFLTPTGHPALRHRSYLIEEAPEYLVNRPNWGIL